MTIYLTRNSGAIWARPWPSLKLIIPAELTQVLGTLVVVYGWFMTPTGWQPALWVWAYALVSWLIASGVKVGHYRLLEHRERRQAGHLARVEANLQHP